MPRVAEAGALDTEMRMSVSSIPTTLDQATLSPGVRTDILHMLRFQGFSRLAAARTQATAVRNCAVDHREPGVLAGLTDARVQWPAHRHERGLRDRPPAPAR